MLTNDNTGAPAACGGSTTVTWTVTSTCETNVVKSATFTVPTAPAVTLNVPANFTGTTCMTQDEVNSAFSAWLTQASTTGGCNVVLTNDNTGAPAACGGSTTVTWKADSNCEPDVLKSATFTVPTAPAVVLNVPNNYTGTTCMSQTVVNNAYTAWLAQASTTGGCNTVLTNDNTGAPAACGGSTTVTWTAASTCESNVIKSATFTVPTAPAVVLNVPANYTGTTCMSQTEVNNAFTNWLAQASTTGGCNVVLTNNNTGAPAACGGSTTVTWTAEIGRASWRERV